MYKNPTIELPKVKKVFYMSDLHIDSQTEQDPLDLPYHPNDGLILLGDYSNHFNKSANYIYSLANRFKWIVFILGNHDYYNTQGGLANTQWLHSIYPYPDNVYHLECETVYTVGNWCIIGDTLWTDYFKSNPQQMLCAQQCLADFKYIVKDHKQTYATPDDFIESHHNQLELIKQSLADFKSKKVILCTHHALSRKSVMDKYKSYPTNGAFVNDCDELFMQHSNIKYALHGHCHDAFKYKINKAIIKCNPLGYKGERGITLKDYYQTLDFIKL